MLWNGQRNQTKKAHIAYIFMGRCQHKRELPACWLKVNTELISAAYREVEILAGFRQKMITFVDIV